MAQLVKSETVQGPARYDTALFAVQILRAAESLHGVTGASILEASGMPAGLLEESLRPLPLAVAVRLVECAVETTEDPLLGLRAGLQTHLRRALGVAGVFLTHAPTPRAWMEGAVNLQNSVSNVGSLSLEPHDDFVSLRLRRRIDRCAYTDQTMDFHVGLAMSLSRTHPDPRTKPRAVELLSERIVHVGRDAYEEALDCAIVPTREHTGARYHADSLRLELCADRDVYDVLRPVVEQEVAMLPTLQGIRDLVAAALERQLVCQGKPLDLNATAVLLGLSRRTLQHRLQEEGTSLQSLVDEVRRRLALRWLESGISREVVSARLGYSESSAFRRAWRRWHAQ